MTNLIGPKDHIAQTPISSPSSPKKMEAKKSIELAQNKIHETSTSSTSVSEIKGVPIVIEENAEKLESRVECPTKEGFRNETSFVIPKVSVQSSNTEVQSETSFEEFDFDDEQESSSSLSDLTRNKASVEHARQENVQEKTEVIQDKAEVVQEETEIVQEKEQLIEEREENVGKTREETKDTKVEVKETNVTKQEADQVIKAAKVSVEKAVRDLEKEGIIIDHITIMGFVITKRVNVNDSKFAGRLEREKEKVVIKDSTSADKVHVSKKDLEDFCKDIGRMRPDGQIALPPEILARYPNARVILLDDLPLELHDQVDTLIANNQLPQNVIVRTAVAMTTQDQKAIQTLVSQYFTLSLQLHVLQTLALRQGSQAATSTVKETSTTAPSIPTAATPSSSKTESTVGKEPQPKKVQKENFKGRLEKEMGLFTFHQRQKEKERTRIEEGKRVETAKRKLKKDEEYFERLSEHEGYDVRQTEKTTEDINKNLKKARRRPK